MSSCSLHICSCSSLITFRTDCRKEERGEKSTQRQSALTRGTPWESRTEGRKCAAGHPGVTVHDHLLSSQEPKDAVFSLTCPIRRTVLQFEQPPQQCLRAILGAIITCPGPRCRVQQQQRWAYMWTHPFYTHQLLPQTYQHLSTRDIQHTCSQVPNPKHSLTPNTTPDSSEASRTFWPFMSTSEKYCNF